MSTLDSDYLQAKNAMVNFSNKLLKKDKEYLSIFDKHFLLRTQDLKNNEWKKWLINEKHKVTSKNIDLKNRWKIQKGDKCIYKKYRCTVTKINEDGTYDLKVYRDAQNIDPSDVKKIITKDDMIERYGFLDKDIEKSYKNNKPLHIINNDTFKKNIIESKEIAKKWYNYPHGGCNTWSFDSYCIDLANKFGVYYPIYDDIEPWD